MVEILVFGLSQNRGGIETYLMKIWQNIDHSQYHFSFIDMTGEGNKPCFYNELLNDGCDFYKVTPRSVSINKNRHDLNILFKEHEFDILHFNVNTLSYIYPVEVSLKTGCRALVHSRNAGAASNGHATKVLHSFNKIRLSHMNIHRIAV